MDRIGDCAIGTTPDCVAREAKNGTTHRILVGKPIYKGRRAVDILRTVDDLPMYPGLVIGFATRLPVELPVGFCTGEVDLVVVGNPGENRYVILRVLVRVQGAIHGLLAARMSQRQQSLIKRRSHTPYRNTELRPDQSRETT